MDGHSNDNNINQPQFQGSPKIEWGKAEAEDDTITSNQSRSVA